MFSYTVYLCIATFHTNKEKNDTKKLGENLSFDIVIIGGSISGLAAARQISRKCDANILVIEEHNKIGEPANSSAFTFTDFVEKYNLTKAVLKYYTKVGWYSFLGSKVIFKLGEPKLAVLDYTATCQQILNQSKRDNIEVYTLTKAIDSWRENSKICIRLAGSHEGKVKCDLLIDASGTSFFSAKYFSYRIPRFYSNPYGYELENCDIPQDFVDMICFFVGRTIGTGGGWFYPISRKTARFGIAEITKKPIFPKDKLQKLYKIAKVNMQPFAQIIKNSVPHVKEVGTIPAEPMKKLVLDNIIRIGDAAGHATPHMLEGIRPCMEFATLCGNVTAEAYLKQDFTKHFLRKIERMWQSQNKLLYLYLLSVAEVAFSKDDKILEMNVKAQAKRQNNPEAFLIGLRGLFKFPISLLTLKPDRMYLETLIHFIYHNIRWLVE